MVLGYVWTRAIPNGKFFVNFKSRIEELFPDYDIEPDCAQDDPQGDVV